MSGSSSPLCRLIVFFFFGFGTDISQQSVRLVVAHSHVVPCSTPPLVSQKTCRNEGSTFNKYFGGSSKKGDSGGDGNAGSGGEGGGGRRSSNSLAGRRGVFARSGSSRGGGDDDCSPLCAEVCVVTGIRFFFLLFHIFFFFFAPLRVCVKCMRNAYRSFAYLGKT